jgi:hypothetical protein
LPVRVCAITRPGKRGVADRVAQAIPPDGTMLRGGAKRRGAAPTHVPETAGRGRVTGGKVVSATVVYVSRNFSPKFSEAIEGEQAARTREKWDREELGQGPRAVVERAFATARGSGGGVFAPAAH